MKIRLIISFLFAFYLTNLNQITFASEENFFCYDRFVQTYDTYKDNYSNIKNLLQKKIKEGADINIKCYNTTHFIPALHKILRRLKNVESLEILENAGANFLYKIPKSKQIYEYFDGDSGQNALHAAAQSRLTQSIPFLLKQGVDISKKDQFGNTPILSACKTSNFEMIRLLAQNGGDINGSNLLGQTCLYLSIQNDKATSRDIRQIYHAVSNRSVENCFQFKQDTTDMAQKWIANKLKTPLPQVYKKCDSFLNQVISNRFQNYKIELKDQVKINLVKFFLEKNNDPNKLRENSKGDYEYPERETPLHHLLFGSDNVETKIEVSKLLLEYGADVNKGYVYQNQPKKIISTPIFGAICNYGCEIKDFNKSKKLIKILLASGATLNIKIKDPKYVRSTPLFQTLRIENKKHRKYMIEFLVSEGAKVNQTDINGNNLLFEVDSIQTVKYLLSQNTNYKIRNNRKQTPLHTAAIFQKIEIIKLFLSLGLDPNARDDFGNTPLMESVTWYQEGIVDNEKIVKTLIKKGAKVNAQNSYRRAALHREMSIHPSGIKIMKILIDNGANVNIRDKLGETPILASARQLFFNNFYTLQNYFDKIKFLVQNKADINSTNNNGDNILHLLVKEPPENINNENLDKIIFFFINNGVNYKLKNKEGKTSYDLIKKNKKRLNTKAYWKLHDLSFE